MHESELAWLAGLFEGEGTLLQTRRATHAHLWALRIAMTDEDVIRRCYEVARVGTITGPFKKAAPRKPIWQWSVYRRDDLEPLLQGILPWLGARRSERARTAMADLALGDRRSRPRVHGTETGYRQHYDRKEPACPDCLRAWRERSRRLRDARVGQAACL